MTTPAMTQAPEMEKAVEALNRLFAKACPYCAEGLPFASQRAEGVPFTTFIHEREGIGFHKCEAAEERAALSHLPRSLSLSGQCDRSYGLGFLAALAAVNKDPDTLEAARKNAERMIAAGRALPATPAGAGERDALIRLIERHVGVWLKEPRVDLQLFPVAARQDIRELADEILALSTSPPRSPEGWQPIAKVDELLKALRGSGPLLELRSTAADEIEALHSFIKRRLPAAPLLGDDEGLSETSEGQGGDVDFSERKPR